MGNQVFIVHSKKGFKFEFCFEWPWGVILLYEPKDNTILCNSVLSLANSYEDPVTTWIRL